MLKFLFLAVSLLTLERNGVELSVEGEPSVIDPGRSVFLTLTIKTPHDMKSSPPDLRGRVRGF